MLRALLCRQAQTWGLTYCTVGIPAVRRSRARRRLNSGASIPTNTSGLAARNKARIRARRRSRRGRWRTISNKPITASDSAGSQTSQPAACIFGPATPKNFASGARRRSALMRSAPKVSPDASPATRPTRSGTDIANRNERWKACCSYLPNDAAFAALDEFNEGPDLHLGLGHFLEFLKSRLQFKPRAVQQSVRAAYVQDLLGSEAPPLQAYPVDAVRHRRPSDRQHIGRNIAGHGGVVRNETVRAHLGVLM